MIEPEHVKSYRPGVTLMTVVSCDSRSQLETFAAVHYVGSCKPWPARAIATITRMQFSHPPKPTSLEGKVLLTLVSTAMKRGASMSPAAMDEDQ
jgi:hypothetical protein